MINIIILVASFEAVPKVEIKEEVVDIKHNLIHLKTEIQNPKDPNEQKLSCIKAENAVKNEFKHTNRIKKCRTLLQNVLLGDPKRNFTVEFIEHCRKWMKILLMSDNDVPLEIVEKCEAILMEKYGELDEIDLKILEINCKFIL